MKISNNGRSPRRTPPPRAAWIDGVSKPGIVGGALREEPTDRTPHKKARSGEAAVDRTAAATAIKGAQGWSLRGGGERRRRQQGQADVVVLPLLGKRPTRPTPTTWMPRAATMRLQAADAASPPRPLLQARAADPPPPPVPRLSSRPSTKTAPPGPRRISPSRAKTILQARI